MIAVARRAAAVLLRSPIVNGALRALARARDHRLVLVYHHVASRSASRGSLVPFVPSDVFRAQLHALGEIVDLVSLDEVVAGRDRSEGEAARPAVAVTFDDDLPSHVNEVLPILRELGVPAAFFLSGRALHGLGAYWFQRLDALVGANGLPHTAGLLGLPGRSAAQLGAACEDSADLRRRVCDLAAALPATDVLTSDAITTLADAGMTIGFHTRDHERVPGMDEASLDHALSCGRDALATLARAPVRYFAYPYGKVDHRAARAVERAGYAAAFTGRAQPIGPRDDRYALGRWEPGALEVNDLVVKLAVRLHRSAPQSSRGWA